MKDLHVGGDTAGKDGVSPAQLRSPDDVHAYVSELSSRRVEEDRSVKAWRAARRLTWIVLLASFFVIYYIVSTVSEMLSLPQTTVSTPVKGSDSSPPPPVR
jgi:hypothetical protein